MKPSIEEVRDFINFLKGHIPSNTFKVVNKNLLENYIENPFEIIDGLIELEALELSTESEALGYSLQSTSKFKLITPQSIMDYVFNKKPGVIIAPKKEKLQSMEDVVKSLEKEELSVKPIVKNYFVFAENSALLVFFETELQAVEYLSKSSETAYMAKILKKATVQIVIENV